MVKVILLVITAAGGNILFFPGQKSIWQNGSGIVMIAVNYPEVACFPDATNLYKNTLVIAKPFSCCKAIFMGKNF
jgi:hypothetical protein